MQRTASTPDIDELALQAAQRCMDARASATTECQMQARMQCAIAEAIAAEREACAQIAEKRLGAGDPMAFAAGVRAAAADIAHEIRARAANSTDGPLRSPIRGTA